MSCTVNNAATCAIEEGTKVFNFAFTDEDGAAVIPDTITWTLTDANGAVVNSRQDVAETPSTSIDIVLYGDDLALSGYYDAARRLTVRSTYTSSLGIGLPANKQVNFRIANLHEA